MKTSASAVSAALRKGGLAVVARHTRDGLSVSQSGSDALVTAAVAASSRTERELLEQAEAVLAATGRYHLRRARLLLYVTRKSDS
jgi:hypothetical protein